MLSSQARRQFPVSLAILVMCGGLGFGLSKLTNTPAEEGKIVSVPLVESRILQPESVQFTIKSQGVVRPAVETSLVSQVSGVITQVSPTFVSGGVFQKGDTLVHIDDSDYRVALMQAEASLAGSEAKLAEEAARSEAESLSWVRSGRKLENAPALLLRKPYVSEAEAKVKATRAQLEKAQRDLERTLIKAPYGGMVRERTINLGQFLTSGVKVGSIFSVATSEVRLPLKPADLAFIQLPVAGHKMVAEVDVRLTQKLGNRTINWPAELSRVEGIVDEQSRMHYVVATVSDPYGLSDDGWVESSMMPLKAGSFVAAELQGKEVSGLYRIPRRAVYADGRVMIIHSDSSLRYRMIKPVYADEYSVFVAENVEGGVVVGDRLCLTPLTNPVEGLRVRYADLNNTGLAEYAEESLNNNR